MGWVAALLNFISYQFKDHKKLLIIQILGCISICISYLFLGATSGLLLNVVCIIRNLIFFNKEHKIFSYSFWPYLLAALMGAVGALSWQGYMSLFIIVALVLNTLFLSDSNVQTLRKSILFTSTLVLIYNFYFTVWGGVFNEFITISSAAIGLYRYRVLAD